MFARVLDPARKLRARRHGPGWIVGKTKVNQIDMFLRRIRNEIVVGSARQIENAFIPTFARRATCVSSHHVRVDIDGIDRIGNRHSVVAENVQDVTAIAF